LKAGFVYSYANFSVVQRYSDIENREKIDSYTVVDLQVGYKIKQLGRLKEAAFEIEFSNLFDKKYVGAIKADDDGFQASQYYAGVPFTVICRLSGRF